MNQKCDHISNDGAHCTEEMAAIFSASRHPGDYVALCEGHRSLKGEGEGEIVLAPNPA